MRWSHRAGTVFAVLASAAIVSLGWLGRRPQTVLSWRPLAEPAPSARGSAAPAARPRAARPSQDLPEPPLDEGEELVGTAHPYLILDADLRERWAALCQARVDTDEDGQIRSSFAHHGGVFGDQLRPYLVLGHGAGEAIEAFLGADPGGRYVAIQRRGEGFVIDSEKRREIRLPSLKDRGSLQGRVGLGSDEVLVGDSDEHAQSRVLRVKLPEATVSTIDLGEGKLISLRVDASGRWLRALLVVADTNQDGKLTPPEEITNRDPGECTSPLSYSIWGSQGGDRVESRWVDLWAGMVVAPQESNSFQWSGRPSDRPLSQDHSAAWRRDHLSDRLLATALVHDERPVPRGPLRWSSTVSPAQPAARLDQTQQDATQRGDCAIYLPFQLSDDPAPPSRAEAPERGSTVPQPLSDYWLNLWDIPRLLTEHTLPAWGGFPGAVELSSPLERRNLTSHSRRGDPAASDVALVARSRGKRYEVTVAQIADDLVARSPDDQMSLVRALQLASVGLLNSVARAEGVPWRLVLNLVEPFSPRVNRVDVSQVCALNDSLR